MNLIKGTINTSNKKNIYSIQTFDYLEKEYIASSGDSNILEIFSINRTKDEFEDIGRPFLY